MSKFQHVWVFSDTVSRLPELMSGAKQLGEQSQVFALNTEQSNSAFQLGASQVWQLEGKPDNRILEDYADTLVHHLQTHAQGGVILLPNSRRGKLLAARLGARLKAAVVNDASAVAFTEGAPVAKHMVYGGLAFSDETLKSAFCVLTVSSGTFEALEHDASLTGHAQPLAWQEPDILMVRNSTQKRESHSVDLDKARLVVSVGRGIGSKDNISLANALCEAIGAELACSRPVAENEKWMEHERYVGISNLMLKPELYLAVGISGQIQHMVGANGAQTLVAINKDKNAPIFQYADYGIVGDLFTILPELTRQLAR
ncbi:electron transfer flavoprotein subunit alpha [Enterobacteriaceae bacterium RIT691]|nr:electron transfer flavoprotein subunit alpha [Enterobacteriaceae bacterium RIT691]